MSSLLFIGSVRVGCCGTYTISGCIHSTVPWGYIICCSLVAIVPSVGGWVHILVCTFIIAI